LDDRHFENRMNLLKKSYEKVPSEFNPEDVLTKLDDTPIRQTFIEEPKKSKKEALIQKASVWLVSLASVFILGIITANFLMNEEEKDTAEVSNEQIEQIKKDYQKEREKRRELLKMDEKRFKELSFVHLADEQIAYLTNKETIKNLKMDPLRLREWYDDAINWLKLPSEMVKELKEKPLTEDETASIQFLSDYRSKIRNLQEVYNEILSDYPDALENNKADGKYNETLIMITSKDEPEEFRNMVETMGSQNLTVKVNEITNFVSAQLRTEDGKLLGAIHNNTVPYYRMMFEEPYTVAGSLKYSIEESVQFVKNMQDTLLKVEKDYNLYPIMENYFGSLFFELMKGSDVFDKQGKVKKEYQEAWINLSSSTITDPTYYLLKPIIQEMKASGWTKSANYDLLTFDDLSAALVLARDGDMNQYIEDVGFEDRTVKLDDPAFWKGIEQIYDQYKESGYDLKTIKGLHPIDALALLEYSNKKEDPAAVFNLIDKSEMGNIPEGYVNEYVKNWTKRVSLFSEADELQFKKDSLYGNASRIHYGFVNGMKNSDLRSSFTMIYTEQETWNVQTNYWLEDPMVHNEEEVAINDDFMQRVHSLYKNFAATKDSLILRNAKPTEIVGLYFYTGELNDFETRYALFYQDNQTELPSLDQYLNDVNQYGAESYKFRDFFKSISFKVDDEYGDLYPFVGGYATLTVDQSRYPDEEKVKGFRLINTNECWRVSFMPMQ